MSETSKPQPDANGWLPIETAPRNGKWILAWWPNVVEAALVVFYCEHQGRWVEATSGSGWKNHGNPTHWQPLPKGPVT